MTDKEKLEKIKQLADAMYYAAQYLTTDASRLHKAMDDYRKFIIYEGKEEPVSEDLEEAALDYAEACKYDGGEKLLCVEHFKAGAKWQKEKDSILPKVWNRENLDEFSYQTAYDLSNDWIKETPTWYDVEMACKLGAKWKEEQLEKEKGRNNNGKN